VADREQDLELISIDEAAQFAKRSRPTLWRWARAGLLHTYRRRLDRRTYVDRLELQALLEHPPVSLR